MSNYSLNSKPTLKPINNCFSSGPCAKPNSWQASFFDHDILGRSHRSSEGKKLLKLTIERLKNLLEIPNDYLLGIISGSASGAIECALWNFLGSRPVDIFSFDFFGKLWQEDITDQLKIKSCNVFESECGFLPDFYQYNSDHDVVFSWCGTTSGVMLNDHNWIPKDRNGLTICDATSAAFCVDLPWNKLDITCFSLQKGLGGEAGNGILVLSPKAVEGLKLYTPNHAIPRIFRLKDSKNQFKKDIFDGITINTPSMLSILDLHQLLDWAENLGGKNVLFARCQNNFDVIKNWLSNQDWIEFMSKSMDYTSQSAVCLVIKTWQKLGNEKQRKLINSIHEILRVEKVAYDFINHMVAPPSLRIWCGPTIESKDIAIFLDWLSWAYYQIVDKKII
jgi:phosphoserine aminotransferase